MPAFGHCDHSAPAKWLKELKLAMSAPVNASAWIIQPVLDHLRPRLEGDPFELMTTLATAIGNRSTLPELDSIAIWKNLCSEMNAYPMPDVALNEFARC